MFSSLGLILFRLGISVVRRLFLLVSEENKEEVEKGMSEDTKRVGAVIEAGVGAAVEPGVGSAGVGSAVSVYAGDVVASGTVAAVSKGICALVAGYVAGVLEDAGAAVPIVDGVADTSIPEVDGESRKCIS